MHAQKEQFSGYFTPFYIKSGLQGVGVDQNHFGTLEMSEFGPKSGKKTIWKHCYDSTMTNCKTVRQCFL